MKKLLLSFLLLTGLLLISFNCTKIPLQPDLNNIKLNLPKQAFDYSTLQTITGTKTLRYEDSSIINSKMATIGRVLFYDKALSINNTIACASCHSQKNGFSDNVSFSKGFSGGITSRNSMNISNLFESRKAGYFWDGRESKIENMVFAPIANHIEMGFDRLDLITEKVGNLPYYKPLFRDCYGDENVTDKRMRESLAQFLFSLVSYDSKFDRGLKNHSIFTSEELDGFYVFIDNCMSCHHLTDDQNLSWYRDTAQYENIGLDNVDADEGRNGLYKIPNLRNVSKTAPYMHDGRFKTLTEVINHYRNGIKANKNLSEKFGGDKGPWPIYLSDYDVDNLLLFLKTLDDNVLLNDSKFSTPF
jgi:cytochrome c peroxidase